MQDLDNRGETVVPIYLALDVSASMVEQIRALSDLVSEVIESSRKSPTLAQSVRLGVIVFSADAKVIKPLGQVWAAETPSFQQYVGGATHFGPVFHSLVTELNRDIPELKAEGYRVHRPIIFLVTDGYPADDWIHELAKLRYSPYSPNIVTVGIGEADPAILREIATTGAYFGAAGIDVSRTLRAAAQLIIVSSVDSVAGIGTGAAPRLGIPEDLVMIPAERAATAWWESSTPTAGRELSQRSATARQEFSQRTSNTGGAVWLLILLMAFVVVILVIVAIAAP